MSNPDSELRGHPAAIGSRLARRPDSCIAPPSSACLLAQSIRIYLEDTDAGGIVYHASWLRFFERARTDWLRDLGIEQSTFGPDSGIGFVVRDLQISFIRPGQLDQRVRTELRLLEVRRASLSLLQQAFDDSTGIELVGARVRIAALRLTDQRAAPMPAALLDKLVAHRASTDA